MTRFDSCKIMNINAIKEARYTFLCNLTSLTFELSLLNRLNILGRSSLRVLHHVDYVLQWLLLFLLSVILKVHLTLQNILITVDVKEQLSHPRITLSISCFPIVLYVLFINLSIQVCKIFAVNMITECS